MAEKKFQLPSHKMKVLIPGPGHYIAQTEQRETKSNAVPFLVSTHRFTKDKEENETPGPGAYNKNYLQKGWIKKFYKSKDPIKTKCRKESKKSFVLTINYQDNDKEKRNDKRESNSKKRIHDYLAKYHKQFIKIQSVSIPNREMVFGYNIDEEGLLTKQCNPDSFHFFSGDKCDSVGPGSYELEFQNNWHRTGTQWSKMKSERMNTTTQFSHRNNKFCLDNLIETNRDAHQTITNNQNTFIKEIWRTNSNITKYNIKPIFKPKSFNDRDLIDFKLKREKDMPGPGYYYEKIKTSFNNENDKPSNIFFGTKTDRFTDKKKDNEKLGPGVYFKHTIDIVSNNKTSRVKRGKSNTIETEIPFSTTTNRFFTNSQNNKNIGPGRYNINEDNSMVHKTFNNTLIQFGLKETRFPENTEAIYHNKDNPGPGSYINPYSNTGTFNTVEYKGMLLPIEKAKNYTQSTIKPKGRTVSKDNNPPVGAYNDDIYQTIAYENIKKTSSVNKSNGISITARNKISYLTLSNTNFIVGPGSYFKENEDKKPQQIYPPFNVSQKKLCSNHPPLCTETYDMNMVWNKPSFNVNFIS